MLVWLALALAVAPARAQTGTTCGNMTTGTINPTALAFDGTVR